VNKTTQFIQVTFLETPSQKYYDSNGFKLNITKGKPRIVEPTTLQQMIFNQEKISIAPAPTITDTDKYFNEANAFIAKNLADDIIKNNHIITTDDNTEDIYIYKEGIYTKQAITPIKHQMQKLMQQELTTHRITETIGHIQRQTYTPREKINEETQYIHCANGILNTENMQSLEFTPDIISTTKIPTTYNPDAQCPQFHEFLDQVQPKENQKIIQEIIGYTLYKRFHIHKALMLTGTGRNGKGVLLDTIKNLLGQENVSNLSLQSLTSSRFGPSNLFGKLANIAPDIGDTPIPDTGLFKSLTGEDQITAERKHKDYFEFTNTAKLMFSANKLPKVKDRSMAFGSRWILLDFNECFEGREDENLRKKLATQEELSGLLNWSLIGLNRLLKQGKFSYDKMGEEIAQLYHKKSNPLIAFVEDCCETFSEDEIPKDALYNYFGLYCKKYNLPGNNPIGFGRELLQEYPFIVQARPRIGGERTYIWSGIGLKPEIKQELDVFSLEIRGGNKE
jgi:putative DNA primase/helicase